MNNSISQNANSENLHILHNIVNNYNINYKNIH